MSFTDTLLDRMESTVDDEYQATVLHRSSSISWYAVVYLTMALSAALAWLVPTDRSWIALLPFAPILIASLIGLSWMKRQVPRPRYMRFTPAEWGLIFLILCIMLGGMYYNDPDANLATATGFVVGGIIGGVVAMVSTKLSTKHGRKRDEDRLDGELADD